MGFQAVEVFKVNPAASVVEQIVDNPVPLGRGDHGGLQGFSPSRGSKRTVEQIVDIPAGGAFHDPPDPGLAGLIRSIA